jgi:hypothetical protein
MVVLPFLGSIVFLIRWMTHSGLPERFLVAPYAVGLAIGTILLTRFISDRKVLKMALVVLVVWMVYPSARLQLLQAQEALSVPLSTAQLDWPFAEALDYIPARAHILFFGAQNAPDYPLFTPANGYSNKVIPWGKTPFNRSRLAELIKDNEVTHVLIQNDHSLDFHWDPPISTTELVTWLANNPDFSEIALATPGMRLFETIETREKRGLEIERGLEVLQVPAQAPLIIVAPSLQHQVGVDPLSLKTPWPITDLGLPEQGFLWLGQGKNEGLEGGLWSKEQRQVILRFDVSPGPARNDSTRTVQLAGQVNGHYLTAEQTFAEPTSLTFTVPLKPGRNEFSFTVLDKATEGREDARHRLVGLHQIVVEPIP